jgi:hypothetical protein
MLLQGLCCRGVVAADVARLRVLVGASKQLTDLKNVGADASFCQPRPWSARR